MGQTHFSKRTWLERENLLMQMSKDGASLQTWRVSYYILHLQIIITCRLEFAVRWWLLQVRIKVHVPAGRTNLQEREKGEMVKNSAIVLSIFGIIGLGVDPSSVFLSATWAPLTNGIGRRLCQRLNKGTHVAERSRQSPAIPNHCSRTRMFSRGPRALRNTIVTICYTWDQPNSV